MRFERKRGARDWPGPQARAICGKAERWGLDVDEERAATGTRYLTITDLETGESIQVRVADHGDAYATADYTVDPQENEKAAVYRWIETHGRNPRKRPRWAIVVREFKAQAKARGLRTVGQTGIDDEWMHAINHEGIVQGTATKSDRAIHWYTYAPLPKDP